jgi:AraC-like DNA-binding protein
VITLKTADGAAAPVRAGSREGPSAADTAALARLIAAYAPHDGRFDLPVPGLHVSRASRTNPEALHAVQPPSLCIVAQGTKCVLLGREVYEYDAARMLVYAVDVPVAAQVTRASRAEPYLGLTLDIDPKRIAELVWRIYPGGLHRAQGQRAVCVGLADAHIVNAATRLVELLAQPGDADLLAPLVVDEILIRLLRGPVGAGVAQIGFAESGVYQVAQAITWLRAHAAEPVRVEALAESAHMSASSFHQHFKAVTSMSPLQFQKVLRLLEARRLLLSMPMDVAAASRRVGYLSASQFSREYHRFFGSSPAKDVAIFREHPASSSTQIAL